MIFATGRHRRVGSNCSGFTLVELAIVLVVLGILLSMAIPGFLRAAERARMGSCFSNQRNLMIAAALYSSDEKVLDGVINSALLYQNGYSTAEVCECPSSTTDDYGDYDIELTDGRVVWTTCRIEGDNHLLEM